jgi:hypothetical protein
VWCVNDPFLNDNDVRLSTASRHLILLLSLSLGFLGNSLAVQLGVITGSAKSRVSAESLHLLSDWGEGHSWGLSHSRNNWSSELSSRGQLFGRGIAILGLVDLSWEDNQTRFVFLQALSVELKRLDTLVGSSVVNSDSNGAGKLGRDAGFLKEIDSSTGTRKTDTKMRSINGSRREKVYLELI